MFVEGLGACLCQQRKEGLAIPCLMPIAPCLLCAICRLAHANAHVFSRPDAVSTIMTQSVNPQVTTASYDGTVRLWDMGMGKSITTLTNHKKAVRAAAMHPSEYA